MKFTNMAKAGVLAAALTAPMANADMLYGIYIGAQGWQTSADGSFGQDAKDSSATFDFDDKTSTSFYVALEHPIPLVPNIKVRQNDIEIEGSINGQYDFFGKTYTSQTTTDAKLTNTDFILYYEILDNDLVSLDIGFNGKKIDGELFVDDSVEDSTTKTFSGVVPMLYGAASVGLPLTGLSVYADMSYVGYDGNSLSDFNAGIQYEVIDVVAADLAVQLGYRSFALELDDLDDIDTDFDVSGAYVGVQLHF
ncbi:hypothetical protein C2869_08790 [Saccharobesus litoralis]|uniref:Outer membrane protein n=1 Tax=Saccharobesus litoralis TaxID=2172099 RepID=A0A2S0VQM8_9ALTE|nr:TIGR04219 family outer membrane beta-barrel protein [Saccharobesus litoralis]AWB66517.1 hypothetical protein C2869_08790 [Saccharobesus litoralis]